MKLYSSLPHILSAVHRVAKMLNDSDFIDQENVGINVSCVTTCLSDFHGLS